MNNCKTFKKSVEGIIAHLILFIVSICIPLIVNELYTTYVPNYKDNHLKAEIFTYIVWFIISGICNFFLTLWISKRVFETKKSSEIYKLILTLSYFFILTLVSFLVLDKLINEENFKIMAFLLAMSFGNLVPIATYNFRNHKEFKNPIPVKDENFYERTTQLKERKNKKYYITYDEFFFYKSDKNNGQTCYSYEKIENHNIPIADSKDFKSLKK